MDVISLLLRVAILRLCSLKVSGKVREKSGNLTMTGEWPPWILGLQKFVKIVLFPG